MQNLDILIVGAGVAGLTCGGLLVKQGMEPVIVEREAEADFNKSGYMLGLLPLGGRVLNALDARDAYFEKSIQMENYEIHKQHGELVKNYPLEFINEQFGSYRGITRTSLIDILLERNKQAEIRFGTTVKSLEQVSEGVEVTFSDESKHRFDVVIVADGIHSETRKQILDDDEFEYKDTGWGGWVTWLDSEPISAYKEYWGAGTFLGLYPVEDNIGVFLGGPTTEIKEKGLPAFVNEVKQRMADEFTLPHQALDSFKDEENPFFWEFHDCRSDTWHKQNVVLLGDAATGFLPTAGVGASMAMDSAAALVDELTRMDKDHVEYGLKLFSKRQKERVEKAQKDSRELGKLMFVDSLILSGVRNKFLPFYSLQRMLSDLTDVMEGV
ncbi:MAG: NAD(P)/FAD-dependent oxidoreductase [Balneolaceae bacterium]|jgi:2-polyprenyl-6-methoxyphenol hydroxylase-like FAD-dependent oxidoreductase